MNNSTIKSVEQALVTHEKGCAERNLAFFKQMEILTEKLESIKDELHKHVVEGLIEHAEFDKKMVNIEIKMRNLFWKGVGAILVGLTAIQSFIKWSIH